jgi:hypothetical protein
MPTNQQIIDHIKNQNETQYQQWRMQLLKRNMEYSNPNWKTLITKLNPQDEQKFLQWIKQNKVPFNQQDKYPDYDMRGFYKALMDKNPIAQSGINPVTKTLHYPDYWKTPYHESFSSESQWATKGAPSWKGDKLILPSGKVVYQDKPGH